MYYKSLSNVNNIKCQQYQMSTMSNCQQYQIVNNVKLSTMSNYQQCQMVNNVKFSNCQQCQIVKMSNCQQCQIFKLSNCHNIKCHASSERIDCVLIFSIFCMISHCLW